MWAVLPSCLRPGRRGTGRTGETASSTQGNTRCFLAGADRRHAPLAHRRVRARPSSPRHGSGQLHKQRHSRRPWAVLEYRVRTFHMEVGFEKSYGWERDYSAQFVAGSLESATRIAQAEADKTGLTVVLHEVPIRSGVLTPVGTFRP